MDLDWKTKAIKSSDPASLRQEETRNKDARREADFIGGKDGKGDALKTALARLRTLEKTPQKEAAKNLSPEGLKSPSARDVGRERPQVSNSQGSNKTSDVSHSNYPSPGPKISKGDSKSGLVPVDAKNLKVPVNNSIPKNVAANNNNQQVSNYSPRQPAPNELLARISSNLPLSPPKAKEGVEKREPGNSPVESQTPVKLAQALSKAAAPAPAGEGAKTADTSTKGEKADSRKKDGKISESDKNTGGVHLAGRGNRAGESEELGAAFGGLAGDGSTGWEPTSLVFNEENPTDYVRGRNEVYKKYVIQDRRVDSKSVTEVLERAADVEARVAQVLRVYGLYGGIIA